MTAGENKHLNKHIAELLDHSLELIDKDTSTALELRRIKAASIQPSVKSNRPWLVAASVAVFLILPWLVLKPNHEKALTPHEQQLLVEEVDIWFEDPLFIETWEMLAVIGDELRDA